MRKIALLLLPVVALCLCCRRQPLLPKPVTKKISFSIATNRNYSDHFYDNAFADVYLVIYKNSRTNGTGGIVWDTTYQLRQYKQYPSLPQQFSVAKEIPVIEQDEQLIVSSVRRHIFNGIQSTATRNDTVKTESLQVSIHF